MAPRRPQKKPVEALNVQIIDFSAPEDTIHCESLIDPQLSLDPQPEVHPESQPSQPSTPSLPSIAIEDRIEWSPDMIQVLFTELLEQAQDGKRADSGFKKEAWDAVLRAVQSVYTGPYAIPLQKVKQKEQSFKGLYEDWKFLREQSGFGWDEEAAMITASDEAWNDVIAHRKSCKWHRNNSLPHTGILEELYDSSIATGTRARTLDSRALDSESSSTSSSSSIRKRSRSRLDPSSESTSRKRTDHEDSDTILAAINRSIDGRKSNPVRAIELLSMEYYDRLSEDDFDRATNILSDDIKASVFVSLPRRDIRDKWLERHAQITFKLF